MQNAYPMGTAAQNMQQYGRNGDTMLMHVSPEEVSGLQNLAQANGTTLTINPQTGMPEAFSLKKLLPTLLGMALTPLTGGLINPVTAGLLVGAGTGLAKGSLKEGLMAGLQAYGGAALGAAGASALGGKAAEFAVRNTAAGAANAAAAAGAAATPAAAPLAAELPGLAPVAPFAAPSAIDATSAAITGAAGAAPAALTAAAPAVAAPATGLSSLLPKGAQQFASKFGTAFSENARMGLPAGTPGMISKAMPSIAASGVAQGVMGAMTPSTGGAAPSGNSYKWEYEGPYEPMYRQVSYPSRNSGSSEHLYFNPVNPVPGYMPIRKPTTPSASPGSRYLGNSRYADEYDELRGYASGGMDLEDGAFIVDARTVSELGNGSSSAGQDRLRRLGGQAIKGKGDGVSDSVKANIGGRQEARVARDEVKFSPKAVAKLGGGDNKRGANKLYALMARAEKARKTAKRGQDTGLASLLGA